MMETENRWDCGLAANEQDRTLQMMETLKHNHNSNTTEEMQWLYELCACCGSMTGHIEFTSYREKFPLGSSAVY